LTGAGGGEFENFGPAGLWLGVIGESVFERAKGIAAPRDGNDGGAAGVGVQKKGVGWGYFF